MNDLIRQLTTFAPALVAQLKGNPVALEEFTKGYQQTLAQQNEQRRRDEMMRMQGEDRELAMADRERLITRQGEMDRVAGEERDYRKSQDAIEMLSKFVPAQETMGGAETMSQSILSRVPEHLREGVAGVADQQLREQPQMITARQRKQAEEFLNKWEKAPRKPEFDDAGVTAEQIMIPLPDHLAGYLKKPQASLAELQQFAQLPVGKPAGRPSDTASMQPKEVMVNGKPVFANYNPKTGTYTDQSGQPVTAEVIPPKPTGGGGVDGAFPPAVQRRIDAKVRGFESNPVVKRTATMAEAVAFSDALDPNTTNPADDQALIYAFAKAMDPDSVVREGEYATVQKYAQSWADQFGFDVKRIFSNTAFLTPQARQQLKATIRTKYGAARGQFENIRSEYGRQIERITRMPGGVEELPDFGAAFPSVEAQTGGKPKRGANPFRPQ